MLSEDEKKINLTEPASVSSSKSSRAKLQEDYERMVLDSEFPDLELAQRRELISTWRDRDSCCMNKNKYRFFQFTNFVGEWRVGKCGSISILAHGSIRRRNIGTTEFSFLDCVDAKENEDFKVGSADVEDVSHLVSLNSEEIFSSENEQGGGSRFWTIPRLILLAHERLGGM